MILRKISILTEILILVKLPLLPKISILTKILFLSKLSILLKISILTKNLTFVQISISRNFYFLTKILKSKKKLLYKISNAMADFSKTMFRSKNVIKIECSIYFLEFLPRIWVVRFTLYKKT